MGINSIGWTKCWNTNKHNTVFIRLFAFQHLQIFFSIPLAHHEENSWCWAIFHCSWMFWKPQKCFRRVFWWVRIGGGHSLAGWWGVVLCICGCLWSLTSWNTGILGSVYASPPGSWLRHQLCYDGRKAKLIEEMQCWLLCHLCIHDKTYSNR